jgi:hypothetical protein
MIRVPIAETTWQAAGIPTIVEDAVVKVRIINDHASHVWIDLPRDGEDVVLITERSSMHRRIAEMLGKL